MPQKPWQHGKKDCKNLSHLSQSYLSPSLVFEKQKLGGGGGGGGTSIVCDQLVPRTSEKFQGISGPALPEQVGQLFDQSDCSGNAGLTSKKVYAFLHPEFELRVVWAFALFFLLCVCVSVECMHMHSCIYMCTWCVCLIQKMYSCLTWRRLAG